MKRHLVVAIAGILAAIAGLLFVYSRIQHARDEALCQSRLARLESVILEYCDKHGSLPPAYVADGDGKPMHSWRMLVMAEAYPEDFSAYDFSEPWDSPNNLRLIEDMPEDFCSPFSSAAAGRTSFVGVVGPSTVWPGARAITLGNIGDRPAKTIFLVEIADSDIVWTEPRDVTIDGLFDRTRVSHWGQSAPSHLAVLGGSNRTRWR